MTGASGATHGVAEMSEAISRYEPYACVLIGNYPVRACAAGVQCLVCLSVCLFVLVVCLSASFLGCLRVTGVVRS